MFLCAIIKLHLYIYFITLRKEKVSEEIALTEADFEDGICDLSHFVYDAEQLTVTEAKPLSMEDFDENRQDGARIVYAVSSGWRIVRREDAADTGSTLRKVFNGDLGDCEFVPANVVRLKMNFEYSKIGGLAGIDAADPKTVEITPEKQDDGTYKVTWDVPTKEGFRIVLDPSKLNRYVVNPPKGDEMPAELEAALDTDKYTICYYEPTMTGSHTVRFVLAGTEGNPFPVVVKSDKVTADQTIVTPNTAAVQALGEMGYELVNKDGDQYKAITTADKLKWIDADGTSKDMDTLKGENIPATVIYLV